MRRRKRSLVGDSVQKMLRLASGGWLQATTKAPGEENAPIPTLEWHITDACNYRCEYCNEGRGRSSARRRDHMTSELVEKALRLTASLPGSWQVKFSHGEPTLHPQLIQICARLCEQGHRVALTTNLSMSPRRQRELVAACGDQLELVTASLHLSQCRVDDFLARALHFQEIKSPATAFSVTTVMLPGEAERLERIRAHFAAQGLRLGFQVLQGRKRGYVTYDAKTEALLSGKTVRGTEEIRTRETYGTWCHTGQLFFVLKHDGACLRCFNQKMQYRYLGSIVDGTFRRYPGPRPCMANRCTCLLPVNRNMIQFGNVASRAALTLHAAQCWRVFAAKELGSSELLERLPGSIRRRLVKKRQPSPR